MNNRNNLQDKMIVSYGSDSIEQTQLCKIKPMKGDRLPIYLFLKVCLL